MKKIKTDPDHQHTSHGVFTNREWEDGGWAHFERWAGVSWFNGHSEYKDKERYGTIRSDKKIPSRFPIHDKYEGAVNGKLEQHIERYEDFDE